MRKDAPEFYDGTPFSLQDQLLNLAQQPENDYDEQNGAEHSAAAIAPVARVWVNRERPEKQKN